MELCCWGGEAKRKDRVLPEVRRSTPGKIDLLLAWTNEAETCDKGEHAEKANGRQRAVVFALDTVFPHAASFTVFPSLNALDAEARGAFSPY